MDIYVRNSQGYFPIAVNMLETYRNMIETCGAGFQPSTRPRNRCYGPVSERGWGDFAEGSLASGGEPFGLAIRRRLRPTATAPPSGQPGWCSRFRHAQADGSLSGGRRRGPARTPVWTSGPARFVLNGPHSQPGKWKSSLLGGVNLPVRRRRGHTRTGQ